MLPTVLKITKNETLQITFSKWIKFVHFQTVKYYKFIKISRNPKDYDSKTVTNINNLKSTVSKFNKK